MTTIPLTEANAKLNELIEDTVATHERVTITRHGRPAAVLISVDDLESMEETLFWQAQPGVHEDIESGHREAAAGQLHDEAAVRRRYGRPQSSRRSSGCSMARWPRTPTGSGNPYAMISPAFTALTAAAIASCTR